MHIRNKVKKRSYCLICYKSLFEEDRLSNLFNLNIICTSCEEKFNPIDLTKKVLGVDVTFLYYYDEFVKKLIYQYKGCYDVVLKDVFLLKHKKMINKIYKDYIIVYPPSNDLEDKKRGFNHIKEICSTLKNKNQKIFYKSENLKQSNTKFNERYKIENIIKIKNNIKLDPIKKYLIIDDIYTSGSTLKTIIKLLLTKGIKKENIKAIIIAKTKKNVEL